MQKPVYQILNSSILKENGKTWLQSTYIVAVACFISGYPDLGNEIKMYFPCFIYTKHDFLQGFIEISEYQLVEMQHSERSTIKKPRYHTSWVGSIEIMG